MNIKGGYGDNKYIIGVTLPRYQNEKGIFSNFIRINYGFPFIQKMIKDLQCHEELYRNNTSSSSESDSFNEPIKRLREDYACHKRKVYTGKDFLTNLC